MDPPGIPRITPNQRPHPGGLNAILLASRERVLDQLMLVTSIFALLNLLWHAYNSFVTGRPGALPQFAVFFAVLLFVTMTKLPFGVRAGTFLFLIYGLGVTYTLMGGIGSAGRLAFVAFPVLTVVLFGMPAGLRAGGLSLLSWLGLGALFSYGGLEPPVPTTSALFLRWVDDGFSLLLFIIGLGLPYRQFLETQAYAVVTSIQKNEMQAAQIALQKKTQELELTSWKLMEANRQLQDQSRILERRATQLGVSAEVARVAASLHDLAELLQTTARLISERFDYYHAGIFLIDDSREWAVLMAASSPGGERMLARTHRLRVGEQGIVGYVTGANRPRIAQDVGGDTVHFANPDLPETRSELAMPLTVRGTVIGALDVQSAEINAFSDEDVRSLQTLADQLAVAIDNAQLFQATRRSLEELQSVQREARGLAQLSLRGDEALAFRYDGVTTQPLLFAPDAPGSPSPGAAPETIQVPLRVGDETLGVLELKRTGEDWSADDLELTAAVADRMALSLENARLYDQAHARAEQMSTLSEIALEITGPQFNLVRLFELIARRALALLNAEGAEVWLAVGPDELELRFAQLAGQDQPTGQRQRRGDGLAGQVFATGAALRVDDDSARSAALPEAEAPAAEPGRAALAVPLTWQQQVLGVLAFTESRGERRFSADDERVAALFAAQAAAALENTRLLQQTQARIAELATINSISQAISAQLSLSALINLVGDQVCQIFGVRDAYVALYNPDTNLVEVPYFTDEAGQPFSVEPFPLGEGISSLIIRSRQPLLINHDTERQMRELGAKITGRPAKSYMGVPMLVGDPSTTSGQLAIGVIAVQDLDHEGVFGEADVHLLTTIASSVGVAIQNVRLFEQTQQRARELATINSISLTLTSQLDLHTLIPLVGEQIRQAFSAQNAFLALYDGQTGMFEIPYGTDGGEPISLPPEPLRPSASAHIIQTRQPLLINHDTERRMSELGAQVRGVPALSFLGVPVITGDEVIGVISVQSTEREGEFSEADLRLLTTIAANVGVAIQNARLFAETRRRAQQLSTAAEVSRASISLLNPDELIAESVELIRERFNLYYVALFLVEPGAPWAVLRHATGEAGRALMERGHRLEIGGQSMIGQAVARRQARIALDVGAEPVRFANPLLPDTRSELALPLAVGESVLGALSVQSTEPNAFSTADIAVLQTMADQIAAALRNAQLLSDTRRTQTFLDSVIENLPIMVFVKDAGDLRFVRWNKAAEDLTGFRREEVIGKSDYDFFPPDQADFSVQKDREVLAGQQLIEIEEEPLQTKARGQRLLTTRKLPILDAGGRPQYLLGISEDITERKQAEAALRDSEAKYRLLLNSIRSPVLALAEDMTILYANQAYAGLHATPVHALEGRPLAEVFPKIRHTPAYDAYQRTIHTGQSEEVEGPFEDRYLRWRVYRTPQGILSISDDITDRRRAEEEILRRNKELAALNRVVQRRAQQLAAAAEIGRAATSTLNLDALLHTSLELVRDRFGFYHTAVFIIEPGTDVAVLRESTGEIGRELKARQHQLEVGSHSLVGDATATQRPVVVQDVSEAPDYQPDPLLPETRAEAVLPLLSGDRVIGALDIHSTTPQSFGEDDLAILSTIADQLAVAVQNARLFDQTARQARRERLVGEITSKIRATGDIDGMLRIAVSELRQALGVSHGAVRLSVPSVDGKAKKNPTGPLGGNPPRSVALGTAPLRPNGGQRPRGNGSAG